MAASFDSCIQFQAKDPSIPTEYPVEMQNTPFLRSLLEGIFVCLI